MNPNNMAERARQMLLDFTDVFFDGILDFQQRPALEWIKDWTDEDEEAFDGALDTLQALWCKYTTHMPRSDQCGIPDHDYCFLCGESLPGKAPRSDTRVNR